MADAVLKLLGKILALIPDERQRLFDYLEVSCPATALTSAERQRRHRLKSRGLPVTKRDTDPVTKRDENVTKHVTNRDADVVTNRDAIPLQPPSKSLTLTALDSTSLDSDSFLQADSKSLNLKTLNAFDRFWKVYPRRVAKVTAYRAWTKGKCENCVDIILEAVQKQMPDLMKNGGEFIPHPATWLNGKRWEDEPDIPPSNGRHPGVDIQGPVEWPPKRKLVQPEWR